jgi:hypothetical protein
LWRFIFLATEAKESTEEKSQKINHEIYGAHEMKRAFQGCRVLEKSELMVQATLEN